MNTLNHKFELATRPMGTTDDDAGAAGKLSQHSIEDVASRNADEIFAHDGAYRTAKIHRASMKGMVVFDYASRYREAAREMAGWLAAGRLKSREHIVEGLETFPDALLKLFTGENIGKLILKVADE